MLWQWKDYDIHDYYEVKNIHVQILSLSDQGSSSIMSLFTPQANNKLVPLCFR